MATELYSLWLYHIFLIFCFQNNFASKIFSLVIITQHSILYTIGISVNLRNPNMILALLVEHLHPRNSSILKFMV